MCGIVGYVGGRDALPVLIKGLERLEYRGYDSAGVAILNDGLVIRKKAGKVAALKTLIDNDYDTSTIGIGHTRWATHGEPNDTNAHPHVSVSGKLAMIHNGIIENYAAIKEEIANHGYTCKSETDSEVLLNFIEFIQSKEKCNLERAVQLALKRIVGAYVILLLDEDNPDTLIAARKGSPLVIGIGENEHFLASDATPIIEYTNKVVYVNDYELAIVKNNELILKNLENIPLTPEIKEIDLQLSAIEKAGYDHFMLKEINEQPKTIKDSLRGRIDPATGGIHLGGLREVEKQLVQAKKITLIACGTSWHAALVAKYVFEKLCRINVEVDYASEYRYRNPVVIDDEVVIAVSQSGETADTIVAIEEAQDKGALILGVCNVVGSSIARISDAGVYTHAGPEIGVASTKAYTAQLSVLLAMALRLAQLKKTISPEQRKEIVEALDKVPDQIEKMLETQDSFIELAAKYKDSRDFLYLGRGINFPSALEGALKLKEISYIHAEGYPAAEMKHGPIALIDEQMPVLFVAPLDPLFEKIVSNIQEVKARKGRVIAITNESSSNLADLVEDLIVIPDTHELVFPILASIPLQLLAYHIGVAKGCNVDQPRNLAKSVTVE